MKQLFKFVLLCSTLIAAVSCDDSDSRDSDPPAMAWTRQLSSDWGQCISPTNDGGFIAFCTSSWNTFAAALYRVSASGNVIDSLALQTLATDHSYGSCQAANGGMWIAFQSGGIVLQRYTADLELNLSTTVAVYDWEVLKLADTYRGIMAVCQYQDSSGNANCVLLTVDYHGSLLSADTLQISMPLRDGARTSYGFSDIAVASNQGVFLAGTLFYIRHSNLVDSSNGIVVKADNDGHIKWYWVWDAIRHSYVTAILPLDNGGVLTYAESRDGGNAFFELSSIGRVTRRSDLTNWFEDLPVVCFTRSRYGRVNAICRRVSNWEAYAETVIVPFDSDGAPFSRIAVPNSINTAFADWLLDGSLALMGWYPSDVFPQPAVVAKIPF